MSARTSASASPHSATARTSLAVSFFCRSRTIQASTISDPKAHAGAIIPVETIGTSRGSIAHPVAPRINPRMIRFMRRSRARSKYSRCAISCAVIAAASSASSSRSNVSEYRTDDPRNEGSASALAMAPPSKSTSSNLASGAWLTAAIARKRVSRASSASGFDRTSQRKTSAERLSQTNSTAPRIRAASQSSDPAALATSGAPRSSSRNAETASSSRTMQLA